MKFCMNMYLDNRSKIREFQRSRSWDRIFGFFSIGRGPLVVGEAAATSHHRIQAAKQYSRDRPDDRAAFVFLVFCFCVRDTAATRGRYLALSKAWLSCDHYDSWFSLLLSWL